MNLRRLSGVAGAFALLLALGACSDNNVLDLEAGQCFQDFSGDEVGNVEIVDCDDPHDNEIFHVETLEGGDDDFPGDSDIAETTAEVCPDEAVDFLGGLPTDDDVQLGQLVPTEDSWKGGDRTIVCYVFTGDEVEGSLEDAFEGSGDDTTTTDGSSGDEEDTSLEDFADLVESCEGGDLADCDTLYSTTPVGSEAEEFGATCGGRSDELLNGNCESDGLIDRCPVPSVRLGAGPPGRRSRP